MIDEPYTSVCGNLVYEAQYGDGTPVVIDENSSPPSPLSYESGVFTINTSDDTLIDDIVPYYLIVKFEDYQGADASVFETDSTIEYKSPCPLAGDTGLSYTTFTATTGTLLTNLYTATAETLNVSSLYTVVPSFCASTITYSCEQTSGPDDANDIVVYGAGTYPNGLCSLTNNVISVVAGEDEYAATTPAT